MRTFNDIVERATRENFNFMSFKYEDDREPVSEAIRGNFGTFDLFLERLKEMRDDYCGAESYQSSSSPLSSAAAAAVLVGGKAFLMVAISLQNFQFHELNVVYFMLIYICIQ